MSLPLRVGFTFIPPRLHAGGFNYLRNLFVALHRYRPGELEAVVFAGLSDDDNDLATFAGIPGVEVVKRRAFERDHSGLTSALVAGIDFAAAAAFRSAGVDVVFEHARFFGWRLPLPAVSWFPDLQHRSLPHLFSRAAWWRREIGFRMQLASGRSIVLSSKSALDDCRQFYPRAGNQMSVVRFASRPTDDLLAVNPHGIIRLYDLPEQYFYLPNQFWRHKNHKLVLNALALLANRGIKAVVAVSGGPDEPPDYFKAIMREVEERGLRENFRYLGMIPLDHVYALLRSCTALINPSRFEGWSTTVEEAKSFEVPMIVSNLAVHREQTGGAALFFDVDDAAALAGYLAEALSTDEPLRVRQLGSSVEARVAKFAEDFTDAIKRAAGRDSASF
ncbi:glycosyltransferase family 1 protein [Bradyrhizobium sp. WYCCWR 12699]|uniref:glycosyltransferase family 4 protein n=1 Tax=Bradyrhizobium sp. WYCCWR 12699 TaxID=3064203 RepID=UPI0028A3B780|nr:glycosyltransferase family 1 protein [Bradyrhizobium sp. WYCCWR 12699]MDT4740715.1 glycosyltransferase family 1 protein [Bradyrhizobium sp. WYCCWR 12699]